MNRRGFLSGALGLTALMVTGVGQNPRAAAQLTGGSPAGGARVRVPGFRPSTRGLRFANEFPHAPVVRIQLPGGLTVPIGDAARGLCGGMVYTVRDLYEAGIAPPATTRPPGSGPVLQYLADRLLDSLSLPFGPATYLRLMDPILSDEDRAWRMIRVEWPAIKADLDRGTLCPLGLITTKSHNPLVVGRNHQVLAWGYDLQGTRLTLRIYDPNRPNDDRVALTLDTARPRTATEVHCSRGDSVCCFFRTSYSFTDPRPVFAPVPVP
jgi:hypothetical protein